MLELMQGSNHGKAQNINFSVVEVRIRTGIEVVENVLNLITCTKIY